MTDIIWLAQVPDRSRIEEADRRLTERLDETLADARGRAGSWLVCRPGCTACCIGPFPINALDAWRVQRGFASLRRRDPARAAAVLVRAREAVVRMREAFPGNPVTGVLHADGTGERSGEAFFERFSMLPCPALDPVTGLCEIYESRPISCRTFGPPVTIGEERLPPCHLCFEGADPATVDACRVSPDAEGLEQRLLREIDARGLADDQTLVAFAIEVFAEGDAPRADEVPR